MPWLQLYFLGTPRITRDEQPIVLPAAKAIALLAYLAVAPTPQTRDRLMDLLWPDSPAEAGRKNLRNTLWAIRRALGDDVVHAAADRLALSETVWVDVRKFERIAESPKPSAISHLQSAISLYRGLFLDGLTLDNVPDFEIWLMAERERLGQLYLRTLATLTHMYQTEGRWREVIDVATRALAYDNLQESMYRALMEAHARLGERPMALRHYDTLRATLERELGVEPLPETQALRAAIVSGELQPIPVPVYSTPRAPGRQPGSPETARVPFVGRHAERAVLDTELQMAAGGHARVVLLTGEVGIGKSRLWQEWSAGLRPGLAVLESRCLEATQTLPFMPLIELFSSQACIRLLASPASTVSPIWLAEVARLVPEIRMAVPDLPVLAVLPPEEERRRLFEAFTQFLLSIGARPLILFIDDLHWADRATLDWLGYLVRRLRDAPLLLVAAYRPEDAPIPLVHLTAGWAREGIARRLELPRLTNEESATLIASLGIAPLLVHRIQAQSAGNPYFLLELSRAVPGDVPPVLSELIRARLKRLPDTAQQVLQAAAILEPDFDFTTLRRTSGRGEEETLDALDALLNAAVLAERNGDYTFTHPLVAAVVREGLSGARRAFLHRRAAEALEATYAGRLTHIAGQLARHYAQAGNPVRAAHYAEVAAERALAVAAPDEAIAFYRQALALEPTPARHMGLGRAMVRQGDLIGAQAAFRLALNGADAQGDRPGAVRACLNLAESYILAGRPDETMRWVEKSLTYLNAEEDPAAHAWAYFLLGTSLLQAQGSMGEAEMHLVEAARLATKHHLPEIAARSRFELGNLLAERGDLPRALQSYRDSIALAQEAGEHFQEVLGHNNVAYHAFLLGDLAAAREHVETGLALAERRALRMPLQYLYSTRGEIALAEQQWAEAEEWFTRGLAEAEWTGNLKQTANYRANLGLAARGRGDLDSALVLLEEARVAAATLVAPHLQTQIDLWLAELYLERGERTAADEALTRAEARLAGGERGRLQAWAERLREQVVAPSPSG